MKVLIPNTFTEAMLVSSNASETYPAWVSSTTYSKDAIVDYGIQLYKSLVNNNTNKTPSTEPTFWTNIGPDNTHAMFDDEVSTQTTSAGPLIVTVSTGIIESVYLGNLVGTMAKITVRNGLNGPVVYQSQQSLSGEAVADWYQYFFFDQLTQRTQALFQGILPYGSSHLTIEIQGSGNVSVGVVSFGKSRVLGETLIAPKASITDYSRKTTDDFGKVTFIKRGYSKRLSVQIAIERLKLNAVQKALIDLRATPCLWISSDANPEYEELITIFGFYKDFTTSIDYPSFSLCNLELEGLI